MKDDLPEFYRLFDKPERPTPPPTSNNVHRLDDARVSKWAATALDAEVATLRATPEGRRNQQLNKAAFNLGQIVAGGALDENDVRDTLRTTALAIGLEVGETDGTLKSGLSNGKLSPRTAPEPTGYDINPAYVIDVAEPEQAELDDFWASRDLLQHVHDYARARRVSPWAVLGVSLARVATATPPWVVLPPLVGGYASLNLFVGLVGPSGAGKGAAEAVAAEAVDVGTIETHRTGSGEGIAHGYMKRTRDGIEQHTEAVLFSVPEIDTLTALGARQGATLMPELRSGWSGERLGFGYADPTKRLPVPAHKYRMCLVAGIQPARAQALLNDSDAGTPQRFLWLPATDPDAPDVAPPCPEPYVWKAPKYGYVNPRGFSVIEVCGEAATTIDTARLGRLRGDGEALDGHALQAQLKTAAALAIADRRTEVTDQDWRLADIIARKSAATRSLVARTLQAVVTERNAAQAVAEATRTVIVGERVEDAAVKQVSRRVMNKLRRESDWVSASHLRKGITAKDRVHVEQALERLIDAGQVESTEANKAFDGHGGSGLRYRIVGVTE